MRAALNLATLAFILISCSCSNSVNTQSNHGATETLALSGLSALPADGVQPWESVDSRGFVIPAGGAGVSPANRGTSAFSASSLFSPGVERFSDVGDVTDNGEALFMTVAAGSNSISGGIYRFTTGGEQPSAIAVDANLKEVGGKQSEYWVGLSNYGRGSWEWHGPYSESQVTLVIEPGGNYLSTFGNTFVAVAVHDGNELDLVGVTVSPLDAADTTAPPTPAEPTLTGVAGGIELSWTDVIAADLAGYHIYWSYSPFTSPSDNGVNSVGWLENTTRIVLPVQWSREVWVGLSAVDTNGNESALTTAKPKRKLKVGTIIEVRVTMPSASAQRNDPVSITASGADLYDFDTDGDGVFDITGDTSGSASVDTSATGLIRPRVRGSSSDGTAVAFGSVSLIVSGNQRPVANAQVTPSFGYAPLSVAMNGTGEDFDGSIAEYAWDFDGDGIYDHNSGADGITAENFPTPGLYNAKLRVTDDLGAWDVDTVSVQVLAAEAELTATPSAVQPGELIHLQLGLPGPGTNLEWDLDGDGTFEASTGSTPEAYASFTTGGERTLRGRGTYSGRVLTGAALVLVHGPAVASPNPDSAGDVGYFTSLAVVNGNPAISYWEGGTLDLKYVRASNAEGSAWGAPLTLDSTGFVGYDTSLEVVNGFPAVSYWDPANVELKYVRATDANGGTWGAPQILDSAGSVGSYTSLAVVNDNPAISYWDLTNLDLKYIRAANADGSGAWGVPQTLDSVGNVGYYTSLAVVNGNPAISYLDDTNSDLKYIRATNADGSAWGAPQTLDSAGIVGLYTSLAVVNGFPAISYYDGTNSDLKYVRASNADGSGAWGAPHTLDSAGSVGSFTSLALVNGIPAVSYWDQINGDLKFVRAIDGDGSAWGGPQTLAGAGTVGTFTSLAAVNGNPAVSYHDQTNGDLKYLTLY
ncbi:MAG: PKD domain-containing protein [bacterium]|nr:PKD domain-containing protein [bacterium]